MKLKVWKFLGLVLSIIFALSAVYAAYAVGVTATITVGIGPIGVAYDSGKDEIFVSNAESNTVSVISDSNNAVVATVSVGAYPYGVAYDSGKNEIFVANYDDSTVSVISDTIPEFSTAALILVMVLVTLCAVALALKKSKNQPELALIPSACV